MVQQADTMPGATPTRISDDQPVTVDPRSYVAAGGEVSSMDESASLVAPPSHRKLPIRAEAEPGDSVSYGAAAKTMPVPTTRAEYAVVQSVLRLCQLIERDATNLTASEKIVLRNDIRTMNELSQLAEQHLGGAQAAQSSPVKKKSPPKKTKAKRR
jgi:hypothetical protein